LNVSRLDRLLERSTQLLSQAASHSRDYTAHYEDVQEESRWSFTAEDKKMTICINHSWCTQFVTGNSLFVARIGDQYYAFEPNIYWNWTDETWKGDGEEGKSALDATAREVVRMLKES